MARRDDDHAWIEPEWFIERRGSRWEIRRGGNARASRLVASVSEAIAVAQKYVTKYGGVWRVIGPHEAD